MEAKKKSMGGKNSQFLGRSKEDVINDTKNTKHAMHSLGGVKYSGSIDWGGSSPTERSLRLYKLHPILESCSNSSSIGSNPDLRVSLSELKTKCHRQDGTFVESGGEAFPNSLRFVLTFEISPVLLKELGIFEENSLGVKGTFKFSTYEDMRNVGESKIQICPMGLESGNCDKKVFAEF